MISQNDLARYQEMGFTPQMVYNAARIAQQRRVDIIDVLTKNMPTQAQPQNKPPLLTHTIPNKTQNNIRHKILFKTKDRLRLQNYECVYRQAGGELKTLIKEQIREKGVPCILENVSNCCYLNSLLMGYFLMPEFVKMIMTAVPLSKKDLDLIVPNQLKNKRIQNSYSLMRSIKSLFSELTLSNKKSLNPSDVLKSLVDYFGNKISYGQEKDLNQMNHHLISRLQECLYYTQDNLENLKQPGVVSNSIKSQINIKSKKPQLKDLLFGTKVEILTQQNNTRQVQSQFQNFLLNLTDGNLYKCLDQQFHYEVDNQGNKMKKDVWITKLPTYLFFYMQRTRYSEGAAIKIKDHLEFDFQIYLDRYMYSNKQSESKKNPILIQHISKRDQLIKQISHSKLLLQSLKSCHQHSKFLTNPAAVLLPECDSLIRYIESLQSSLQEHQKFISNLESRNEKYFLKYIIVHRGSISSGHYWGYGYTGEWWRYDVTNSKVTQEEIKKQISQGDIVVYALIYTKLSNQIYPSFDKFLKVPEPDLLGIEQYSDWVADDVKKQIVYHNNLREQAFEERRIWQSFQQITLEYDQIISEINKSITKMKQQGKVKTPYLSSFPLYLRSLSDDVSSSFKLYCLDKAIKKITKKYSIDQQPDQQFSKQLRQVIRNNVHKENLPDKFKATKFDVDKITQKKIQYLKKVKARLGLNALFDNLKEEKWKEAADCACFVLNQNLKENADHQYSKQLLSVIVLKLHNLGQSIPKNYLISLAKQQPQLTKKISNMVKVSEILDFTYMNALSGTVEKKIEKLSEQPIYELDVDKTSSLKELMSSLSPVIKQYRQLK